MDRARRALLADHDRQSGHCRLVVGYLVAVRHGPVSAFGITGKVLLATVADLGILRAGCGP